MFPTPTVQEAHFLRYYTQVFPSLRGDGLPIRLDHAVAVDFKSNMLGVGEKIQIHSLLSAVHQHYL